MADELRSSVRVHSRITSALLLVVYLQIAKMDIYDVKVHSRCSEKRSKQQTYVNYVIH